MYGAALRSVLVMSASLLSVRVCVYAYMRALYFSCHIHLEGAEAGHFLNQIALCFYSDRLSLGIKQKPQVSTP